MANGDTEAPKCYVCFGQFQFTGPDSYLMPCLHSVCEFCMESDENLFCSTCKQHFPNDDTFPSDATQKKATFLATLKNNPSEVCCTNRKDDRKALYWCPQCEALLCGTCEETHKDMKLTKNHEVKSLSTLLQNQEGINPKETPCPYHSELHLSLYDETCEELICYKCKAEDHARCDVTTNDMACSEFKKKYLPDALKKLEGKKGEINLIEDEIEGLSNILAPRVKAVKKSIKRSFDTMTASLKRKEKEMDEATDASFKEVEQRTKERLTELKLEKVRLERTLEVCRSSQGLSFPPNLLDMKSTMINRVDECLERELPKVSKMEADIHFSNKDEQDLLQIISTAGVLYSTWSNAATPLPSPPGILSETRAQLKLCQEQKRKAEEQLGITTAELKTANGLLHETTGQLHLSREVYLSPAAARNGGPCIQRRPSLLLRRYLMKHRIQSLQHLLRCQGEKQLAVCIEKLKNATSFIEKATFKVSFNKTLRGPWYSSEKVLKTIPWYVEVQKVKKESWTIGCFLHSKDCARSPGWSCRLKATFKVESKPWAPVSRYLDHYFHDKSLNLGYADIIPMWQQVFAPILGTIKLRVDVEAWESKGLVPLEDRLRKEFDETLATLHR